VQYRIDTWLYVLRKVGVNLRAYGLREEENFPGSFIWQWPPEENLDFYETNMVVKSQRVFAFGESDDDLSITFKVLSIRSKRIRMPGSWESVYEDEDEFDEAAEEETNELDAGPAAQDPYIRGVYESYLKDYPNGKSCMRSLLLAES